MARLFTVASWNVEHFRGDPARAERVADFLAGEEGGPSRIPEIFALYEVEGKDAYCTFMRLDLSAAEEIARLSRWAARRNMTLVAKDEPATWWNGGDTYDPSDLDHLLASEHLDIRRQDGSPGVSVIGWPQVPQGAALDAWLEECSDHAMLYFEVRA